MKGWRRAPKQILRRELKCRKPHPLAGLLAKWTQKLIQALNNVAHGIVTLQDALCLTWTEKLMTKLDQGGDEGDPDL